MIDGALKWRGGPAGEEEMPRHHRAEGGLAKGGVQLGLEATGKPRQVTTNRPKQGERCGIAQQPICAGEILKYRAPNPEQVLQLVLRAACVQPAAQAADLQVGSDFNLRAVLKFGQ